MPVHFEYVEALERDSGCVTFLCRTVEDTPRTVVVKFTEAYCPEAHELLAAKGMAPELLYCGSVDHSHDAPSYQPLKMIVMEYIDGKTAVQLQNNLPEDFAVQLSEIISVLHTGGYVFGDLRLPNIMVAKKQVKLIDFDWAGKVGLAKYPIHLARNISWPTGAMALGQIEKAHDLDMLCSLITTTAA
jgi:serine/threonine protein kinase